MSLGKDRTRDLHKIFMVGMNLYMLWYDSYNTNLDDQTGHVL